MGLGVRRFARHLIYQYEPLWFRQLRMFLVLPKYPGTKLTLKRVANCYRNRWEMRHLSTELQSYPLKLTVEPINTCNLSCPACFTGDGQTSRPRKTMPMDFYQGLLDEAGDYLWQIEFCNWGEPLLNKQIATMIRAATDRGIGTLVSTNFSFPFDERRAEDLVRSGLTVLGVSIDGTQQETYEQYRVGGNLETVLANCRKIRDAKRRLGLRTPHVTWIFHVFPHNVYDVATARTMAPELDMELVVEKGWVVGDEWERNGFFKFRDNVKPFPCLFLWNQTVVNSDGGVSPCCGTFYREDDMGTMALEPAANGTLPLREVWNGERFRQARQMYQSRGPAPAEDHVCYNCPATILWHQWQQHLARGGDPEAFETDFTPNDSFNYFCQRRPPGAAPPRRRLTIGTR